MAEVFDVVSQAGTLSLEELKIRSSSANVEFIVADLEKQGLVEVTKEHVPETPSVVDFVSLTTKGFKAAMR